MTVQEPPSAATAPLCLCLYVAGQSPNSQAALVNLRAALELLQVTDTAALEIVDVLLDPDRGVRDRVMVTPMLIKTAPPPERRILGNLHDRAVLLGVLGRQGGGA